MPTLSALHNRKFCDYGISRNKVWWWDYHNGFRIEVSGCRNGDGLLELIIKSGSVDEGGEWVNPVTHHIGGVNYNDCMSFAEYVQNGYVGDEMIVPAAKWIAQNNGEEGWAGWGK